MAHVLAQKTIFKKKLIQVIIMMMKEREKEEGREGRSQWFVTTTTNTEESILPPNINYSGHVNTSMFTFYKLLLILYNQILFCFPDLSTYEVPLN